MNQISCCSPVDTALIHLHVPMDFAPLRFSWVAKGGRQLFEFLLGCDVSITLSLRLRTTTKKSTMWLAQLNDSIILLTALFQQWDLRLNSSHGCWLIGLVSYRTRGVFLHQCLKLLWKGSLFPSSLSVREKTLWAHLKQGDHRSPKTGFAPFMW